MKYYIYGIYSDDGTLRYIGQTKQLPDKRFKQHMNQIANVKRNVKTKTKPSSFHKKAGKHNWILHQEILGETNSKKQANMIEAFLILREIIELGNNDLCNSKLEKMWLDDKVNWKNYYYF